MHCCQIYSSWQSIETEYSSSFQAYFYAEAPDKQKLFGRITGKNYPLQFGRCPFNTWDLYDIVD